MTTPHLDAEAVALLVGDAVTAPSMHNAQPWRFVFRAADGVIELHGDPQRAMARSDPDHRALHLGCAAALFNLRVSAARSGRRALVRLLPEADEPWLFARVAFEEPAATGHPGDVDALAALHCALRKRHTSRHSFGPEQVPAVLLDGLRAAARSEGCQLTVPGPWHIETVLALVRDAQYREACDPLVRAEKAAWMNRSPGADQQGSAASGFVSENSSDIPPVSDVAAGSLLLDRSWASVDKKAQLALLGTSGDAPADWLRAGQALERVLLQATADGMATSMTSQPLEWEELRWSARDPTEALGQVQMAIRVGYGPDGTITPRRAVAEILETR
ncbi:Acg family FMN-binding oxidoreductase [Streptomyces sp. NPDC051546]|uniref:Acg family FMN-binding oxidoreductase n=1 Tax=Streptomyces sp. NPDC051546 TaxID=3365655 RepID=UPI0037B977C5